MRRVAGSPFVLVVSPASPTTERLLAYFNQCGVRAELRQDPSRLAGDGQVSSLVVFPDRLSPRLDPAWLRRLRRRFPTASLAFVTGDTRRYAALAAEIAHADQRSCVVLARPVWGHVLLDHVQSQSGRLLPTRARPPSRPGGRP